MLTDHEAQHLLHQAGYTIDVDPAGPLDTSLAPRRRWPVLASAAVVALIVGGVTLGIPGDPPTASKTPPASADVTPPDHSAFRLGPDQVPSVFGHTESGAVALLEAQGLTVEVRPEYTCTPFGYAARTEPPTGSLVSAGDPVRLHVTEAPPTASCVFSAELEAASALIAHALGDAPAPATEPGVDLEPALERLRTWAEQVGRYSQDDANRLNFPTPELAAASTDQPTCGSDGRGTALEVAVRLSAGVTVEFLQQCRVIYLHYAGKAGVSSITRVDVPRDLTGDERGPADVVGNSVQFATTRLEAQGYVVEPIARADCQPLGLVTAQRPYPNEDLPQGSSVRLAYTDQVGACLKNSSEVAAPGSDVADAFVAFARGGEPPAFADEVEVYWSDFRDLVLTGNDRAAPTAWQYECPDTASCLAPLPPSALEVLASYDGKLVQSTTRSSCPAHPRVRPLDFGALTVVRLGEPEPASCEEAFAVELYLDDAGRIAAVDLLLGADYLVSSDPGPKASFAVPEVIGLQERDAIAALESAGLRVEVTTSFACDDASAAGTVVRQSATITDKPPGSTVEIVVAGVPLCPVG